MPRARNIKPSFFDNEILGELPAITRLLFIGLWCLSDREGRLEDRPLRIKKEILGYDDVSGNDVDVMLWQLHNTNFIDRYSINGFSYIQIINFTKHQNPHIKEKDSEIPLMLQGSRKKHNESTVQVQCKPDTIPEQAVLIPDSRFLNPEPLSLKPNIKKPSVHNNDMFDEFWELYPKKQAKQPALKSFAKLNPSEELFAIICNAVVQQSKTPAWIKENGQYIPMASTWLNGKRWEDIITVETVETVKYAKLPYIGGD